MAKYRNKPVDAVIDVRSHLEFFFGHLPGSVCIPLGSLERAVGDRCESGELTPDSSILVVCASGARSANAVEMLRRMGYRRVVDGGPYSDARAHYAGD